MLRHHGMLTVCMGLCVALPLGALQEGGFLANLQAELARTESALDLLGGYREQAASGAPVSVDRLRLVTEAPSTPPDLANLRLEALQSEVRELEVQLEALRTRRGAPPLELSSVERRSETNTSEPVTVGLDPERLRELALGVPPDSSRPVSTAPPQQQQHSEPAGPRTTVPTLPVRPPVIKASDPRTTLATARALYRSGDHSAALERFRLVGDDAESRFWIGRCLEQLGRDEEALAAYDDLAADEQAGQHAERASESASFLRWKRSLEQNAGTGGTP